MAGSALICHTNRARSRVIRSCSTTTSRYSSDGRTIGSSGMTAATVSGAGGATCAGPVAWQAETRADTARIAAGWLLRRSLFLLLFIERRGPFSKVVPGVYRGSTVKQGVAVQRREFLR